MKLLLILSKFTMQCYHDGGFWPMIDTLNCKVHLNGVELWRKFHENDTEMIITNNGRRMFPTINIKVDDLKPQMMYCMLIHFEQVGNCREKYSTSTGWSPAGNSDAQNPNRTYIHPRSPAKGSEWMANAISFNKLKLTNKIPSVNQPLELGHIVLSSMHRYQPKIIIIQSDKLIQQQQQMYHLHHSNDFTHPTKTIVFPELCFVAVTAYQNQEITKLKVENNPFAKGFKENGKSYAKRKRRQEQQQQQQDKETIKIIKIDDNSPVSSPEIQVDDDPPTINRQTSPAFCQQSTLEYLPFYSYNYQIYPPIYPTPMYWYQPYYYQHLHPQYQSNLQDLCMLSPQDLAVRSLKNCESASLNNNQQKPKVKQSKSEFTIDAILRK